MSVIQLMPFPGGGGGGSGDPTLDAMFDSGEVGDVWRFDTANMNVTGTAISDATGIVNGLVASTVGTPNLNTIDGNECALFDGFEDSFFHDFGSPIAQPGTIILSADLINGTTRVIAGSNDTDARWQISMDVSGRLLVFAGATLLSTRSQTIEKAVVTVEFDGASTRIRINGVDFAVGDAGTQSVQYLTIGASGGGGSAWTGSLYGAMFIDRLLTASERDYAERLLGSYGSNEWPDGNWDVMFNGGTLTSNTGGWNGYTWRQRIPASSLEDISGTVARIMLQAGGSEGLTVSKAYIGVEGSSNFVYDTAPTQLTWNDGSASVTLASLRAQFCDDAAISLDGTEDVVISLYINGGTSSDTFRYTSTMNGVQTQYKGGVDEAAKTGALSGYTAQNSANPIMRLVVA